MGGAAGYNVMTHIKYWIRADKGVSALFASFRRREKETDKGVKEWYNEEKAG